MRAALSSSAKTWLIIIAIVAVAAAAGAAGKWVVLGDRVVNDRAERDTIKVDSDVGLLSAIKIKVRKGAVEFRDVKVHFANGDVQDVKLKRVVKAGDETRVIDLHGGKREVEKVVFWYDAQTRKKGKRSKIRLLGRR